MNLSLQKYVTVSDWSAADYYTNNDDLTSLMVD